MIKHEYATSIINANATRSRSRAVKYHKATYIYYAALFKLTDDN